jgi:hypothetical protein
MARAADIAAARHAPYVPIGRDTARGSSVHRRGQCSAALIPRYRHRIRTVPLDLGRPVWVDSAQFDLAHHVRRTALPAEAGHRGRLASRGGTEHDRADTPRRRKPVNEPGDQVRLLAKWLRAPVVAAHEVRDMVRGLVGSLHYLVRRFAFHVPQRTIVAVTTNVPGPRRPLYVLGRQILEILPCAPIALRMRTGVAVLSYCDQLTFGISADYDRAPEVDLLGCAIADGITELVEAAQAMATERYRPRLAPRRPAHKRARGCGFGGGSIAEGAPAPRGTTAAGLTETAERRGRSGAVRGGPGHRRNNILPGPPNRAPKLTVQCVHM